MATPTFYTKSEISHLKIEECINALNDRGLDTTGKRKELQQRLRHAIHPDNLNQSNQTNGLASATNVTTNSDSASQPNEVWDLIKVKSGPVYRRIPKANRPPASKSFTTVVTNVTRNNDKLR